MMEKGGDKGTGSRRAGYEKRKVLTLRPLPYSFESAKKTMGTDELF